MTNDQLLITEGAILIFKVNSRGGLLFDIGKIFTINANGEQNEYFPFGWFCVWVGDSIVISLC